MAHGAKDWSKYGAGGERYSLQDMAELAARLGSPVTYDRRGEVLWYDRMQDGTSAWEVSSGGTGGAGESVGEKTFWPGFALKLTAGSTSTHLVNLSRWFSPSAPGKFGLEASVWLTAAFESFDLFIYSIYGDVSTISSIRLNKDPLELQYYGSDGLYHTVAEIAQFYQSNMMYVTAKFVGDFVTGEYIRALFGRTEYDLTGTPMQVGAGSGTENNRAVLRFTGRSGFNDTCQIGNVVYTVNEP